MTCQQCGSTDSHGGHHAEFGWLCLVCGWRQHQHDEARDNLAGLTALPSYTDEA